MGYLAWRYRNSVMHQLERIFIHADGQPLIPILKICFGDRWKDGIERARKDGAPPEHAAVILTSYMVPSLLAPLSSDQKELTQFAFETGNEAELIASNFFSIIRQTRKVAGDEAADDMFLRFRGALLGHEDLDRFVADEIRKRGHVG